MDEIIYTDSKANDLVKEYLMAKKEQIAIIEHLGSLGRGNFLFNPLETTEEIKSIFLQNPEDFRFIVRRSLFELVGNFFDDQKAVLVSNNVKIIITTSTEVKFNQWSSKHEGIPLSSKCQIIGSLNPETYTKFSECVCVKCKAEIQMRGNEFPVVCENDDCPSRKFIVNQKTAKRGDVKTVIIQEPMDEVKHGSPKILTCIVKDELIFDAFPGQKKIITGVFKSIPKKNTLDRNIININAISLVNIDDENFKMPSTERLEYFKSLSKQPNYLKIITDSFAPEIKFRELEKISVIISRVGAKKNGRIRGNIHCLLIGPAATGKSKILEFLPDVTQRCGFATGGMATGAGITVAMTTLPDKTKFPKGGIVVESTGSLVVLDEFNQFPDEDIGKTYTCMESGKIFYNKGGFNQEFIADTTIVAGANPKSGEYVIALGMVKNIHLPLPMISRFDIIVNVLPEKSETESQQISDHSDLIKDVGVEQYIKDNQLLKPDELLELFNHANSLSVKKSPEAKELIDDYVKIMMNLQNSGDQIDGSKQFDRRFIESVDRISEALTKLHFQTIITKEFAMIAIDYIKKTLDTFGVKTDKGVMTIPLNEEDTKDRDIAFDKTWIKMCKDADSQFLPEYNFLQFLISEYPKAFTSIEKAEKYFKDKIENGDLIRQGGRYKLVK